MNKSLFTVGAATMGGALFVAGRLFIRSQVEKELAANQYDETLNKPMYALVTKPMNFPTAAELAEALVPVWSLTGPYAAIEDVLNNGRQSQFWPDNRRDMKVPKAFAKVAEVLDEVVFAMLRKMYAASARAEAQAAAGVQAKTNRFIPSHYSVG